MTRQEAINIIIKALETCRDDEIAELYAMAVSCANCPLSKGYKCKYDCIPYVFNNIRGLNDGKEH